MRFGALCSDERILIPASTWPAAPPRGDGEVPVRALGPHCCLPSRICNNSNITPIQIFSYLHFQDPKLVVFMALIVMLIYFCVLPRFYTDRPKRLASKQIVFVWHKLRRANQCFRKRIFTLSPVGGGNVHMVCWISGYLHMKKTFLLAYREWVY